MTSLLDIVNDCDNFPYPDVSSPNAHEKALRGAWLFYLPDDDEPHGILPDAVVERMPWTPRFHLSTSPHKRVTLLQTDDPSRPQQSNTASIQALISQARSLGTFPRLGAPTPEHFPILGARTPTSIERPAISLFGIVGRGAHMTVYTLSHGVFQFWVARRSATKSTYPGMLDQPVAGGVAAGETPLACIAREAAEEAGLAEEAVRERAVAAGTVSWFGVSDERAGGEVGLLNPGLLYVYDLEVGAGAEFEPVEGDIDKFSLMGLRDVLAALRRGEFKPSCALVMLDFLIRHGLVTADSEPDYGQIVSRLHRKLPFRVDPRYE